MHRESPARDSHASNALALPQLARRATRALTRLYLYLYLWGGAGTLISTRVVDRMTEGLPEQLRAQFSGLTAACSHATMTKCCLDKKRLLHAQALRCTEPRAAHNSVTTAVTCCFSHIVWRIVNVGAVQMEWWHLGVAAPFPSRLATHWGH